MTKRPTPRSARGKSLFEDSAPAAAPHGGSYSANIDGAARGNPGPASYGVVVRDPSGAVVAKLKKYMGRSTNNVAEYYALIATLDYAQSHGIRALRIESDSELLVKQMHSRYKVRSADLRPLFEQAKKMSRGLESFIIEHVFRERNREADALANQALDETGTSESRPESFAGKRLTAGDLENEQTFRRDKGRIRARYREGSLHPLEPLDLKEGVEVELTIYPSRTQR